MHKNIKIFIFLIAIIFIILILPSYVSASSIFDTIDIDDFDLSHIDKSKVDELKDTLERLSGTVAITSINEANNGSDESSSVDINALLDFYQELSNVISNDDIANFINENKNMLANAGINKNLLSTSSALFKNFDANTVIDIARNDLDMDKILENSNSATSTERLLISTLKNTSTLTKISIILKLLFSNGYFRLLFFFGIVISIYSIIITGFIFKKAGKPNYITYIPIYRDIIHLKLCNFPPFLLILILIPFIGWLALMAIAVVRKI